MYVRWQYRTNDQATARPRPVGATDPVQQPAARDLALEAAACAVTISRCARRANSRSRRPIEPRRSLVAVIVESRRVDGRPRQHLIQYVGCIARLDVHHLSARRRFWDRADAVLVQFDQEQRARFEQTLETKVPRPTAEEVAAASPAAIAARLGALRAARAAERSRDNQAPVEPSTVAALLTGTDTGDNRRRVGGQAEAATGIR
jgi:hypothetical protein